MIKHKKGKILGGFIVDFWAIVVIFILLLMYITFSIIMNKTNNAGVITSFPSDQTKSLTSIDKLNYILDVLFFYKDKFKGDERDFNFVINSLSNESSKLVESNVGEYLNFFKKLNQIPYFEVKSKDNIFFCLYPGFCVFKDPKSDEIIFKLSDLERDSKTMEFYIEDVRIRISTISLSKYSKAELIKEVPAVFRRIM